MNVRALASVAVPMALFVLAACGGYGSASYSAPTPGPTCLPASTSSQLVYPAPGATAVPDSITQIVIATNPALQSNTYNLALSGANGFQSQTANDLVQISASQVPPGSAPVTFANPTYLSVQLINAFPAAQAVSSVAVNNPASNCTPMTIPGASFTTQ